VSTEGEPVLVDTVAAGLAVHVAPATVRGWKHRGLIEGKGKDARGRVLYSLADVYAAAEKVRGG
jgi:DNA-binding transcriptional MerR regulator